MTKLYEAGDHLLLCAGYADPVEHRHMAAHILIAMDGLLEIRSGEQLLECRGIMIPSGVRHGIRTQGGALVFLFDSTTNVAARITTLQEIPDSVCKQIRQAYEQMQHSGDYDGFAAFVKHSLDLEATGCRVTDQRMRRAMEWMRSHATETVTCADVAEAVFMSESRFSHLFKEQLGMTVPAYLIYQRLMYVYTAVLRGRSITESALAAGFSSSGHFADVSRRVFGLSASEILKDLTVVRVT